MPPEVTTAPAAAAPAEDPAASPAAAPVAQAPAAPAAPAQSPAAAPATETLFTKPPAAPPADGVKVEAPDWLPEKYRVLNDGKLDLEASGKKMSDGLAAAVKRIGSGDLPPETPDAYADSPVPDDFKDVPLDPELTRSFREGAHKAGLTQSQLDFVMGEYFKLVPSMLNASAALTADEARSQLSKVWGTPAELQSNMTAAERAVAVVPADLQEQIRTEFGTNPLFWQFAAQFGKEVGEDKPVTNGGGQQPVTDTDALMRTEAYRNAKHPDHAKVSAQVREAFERRHGTAPAMS